MENNSKENQIEVLIRKTKNYISKKTYKSDEQIVADSRYFDWKWYCQEYRLEFDNALSAADHYINEGYKYLYDPSEKFVTIAYWAANWDVKLANCNPLLHYEKYGKKERRKIGNVKGIRNEHRLVESSDYFDEAWYRENYKLDKSMEAVYHFLFIGVSDYYNPSKKFSTIDYIMDNSKELSYMQNPLVHFEKNKNRDVKPIIKDANDSVVSGDFGDCMFVNEEKKKLLVKYNREEVKKHTESVDIIICVYNAYEDVKKCIESVLEHTSQPYRIIIVDDNSAELTANYLREVSENNENVKLIRNDSDLHGYTYAANIGLRNSTADFNIMLNSDTIVSEHWLDNMIACANSDPEIGVVGPLSNTASWQSVPKLTDDDGDWCHNVIPQGFSIAQTAQMIEDMSERIYPQVPLLNGFCLMICRKVVDEIGYFDEENFGRGFAEEDDYNTRAIKAGFKLAVADDTYIFHAQSKSYTDEKRLKLCKLSGEALRQKHGQEYIDTCSAFMATNKIMDSIRKRVSVMYEKDKLVRDCKEKYAGKKLLFLLPGSNASGGANVIVQESLVMKKMGVDITFLNLKNNKDEYEKAYGKVDIPVKWIDDYSKFDYSIAKEYDVVICTIFRTVRYCKFLEKYNRPKIAYYIQDYEPYFIEEELLTNNSPEKVAELQEAIDSYTLISKCINITKTEWNRDEVRKHTGADCNIIGPSVNVEQFIPRKSGENMPIVITAMIRPNTKRRAPQMTFEVLRKIKLEFGRMVEIRIFGADPDRDSETKFFFVKQKRDFEFYNYGLTSPEETARLLSESDIFVDFSEFQAMGLTAMEAMACGCATIVPKNGGTGCFAVNNENCLVIDTMDMEACLNSVRMLVTNKQFRYDLGRKACMDMIDKYPEKVANSMLSRVI